MKWKQLQWGRVGHNEYTCAKCKNPITNYRERVRVEVTVYQSGKGGINSLQDFHKGCTSIDKYNLRCIGH